MFGKEAVSTNPSQLSACNLVLPVPSSSESGAGHGAPYALNTNESAA